MAKKVHIATKKAPRSAGPGPEVRRRRDRSKKKFLKMQKKAEKKVSM
jgi:hypothetical protein